MAKKESAADREYKAAMKELDAIAVRDKRTGNREETPAYWAANARVAKAEKKASGWTRLKTELGR